LFKAAAGRMGVSKGLLHDGFFSFAVARQMFVMLSKIILLAIRSQALKTQNR